MGDERCSWCGVDTQRLAEVTAERDLLAGLLSDVFVRLHQLQDGNVVMQLPNGKKVECGWADKTGRIWGTTDSGTDYPTLLDAIRAAAST